MISGCGMKKDSCEQEWRGLDLAFLITDHFKKQRAAAAGTGMANPASLLSELGAK